MRHLFIVNPIAGGTSKYEFIAAVEAFATEKALNYHVHTTRAPGDAQAVARRAVEASNLPIRVYSCGGDGTINEVINGIYSDSTGVMQKREHVELAVLPIGSGNDFARYFANPAAFLDLSAQLAATPVIIDLLSVNGRLAINLANIGLDAVVAHNMGRFRSL